MTDTQTTTRGAVIDLARSQSAKFRPAPLTAVALTDAFWEPRIRINRETTLPFQLAECEATGRINNFRRASGKKDIPFEGIYFNDSDVYKMAEAMAYSLATNPDPKLDAALDAVIQEIADAQQPDGYLNTYFMFERESERYTNTKDMHEIYCAGHLIQAAVAHHRATGKTTLLDIAIRLADNLDAHFGPNGRIGACGHEEAEMALVELYRDTQEPRYLMLAQRMIEARGQKPGLLGGDEYHQDHRPVREQTALVGHAVRHLYLACGVADVVLENGSETYRAALETLWDNLTQKKMYVTGGAGARWEGEAFGDDYELPNERAYTETCAAIASVMWNWRMLNLTGEAKYADVLETALYNGVMSGLSLDGTHYFYQNPLADHGRHRREKWFGCACCPPNIARLLASLPNYFYSTDKAGGVWCHLYAAGAATLPLETGGSLTLNIETNYPWDGKVTIRVGEDSKTSHALHLRIPQWTDNATLLVDGVPDSLANELKPGSYVEVSVRSGTVIELDLPMRIERVESHPHVAGNRGRVALRRGPLVYCIEQIDFPANVHVWDVALPEDAELVTEFVPELLGGVVVLKGRAVATNSGHWNGALYAPYAPVSPKEFRFVPFTAIPYYAWANREAGPMQVWIPTV